MPEEHTGFTVFLAGTTDVTKYDREEMIRVL